MTDSNETPPEGGADASPKTTSNVTEIYADNMSYDTDQISDFFDMVFHKELSEGEHILAQASRTAPRGYGKDFKQLLPTLARTKQCMPCYFGSSTLTLTEGEEGTRPLLRNKKTAFKRFNVVLLDDIGTKIPWESLPKGLDPTYSIESSPDNFQLGFVLEEPIEDYDTASLLCHYVKQSGLTDKGGIMPCKKIRMPCGVNGKNGDNKNFPVKLHDMEGPYWSPQALLNALGVEVDWAKVSAEGMSKTVRTRLYGATAWSPVAITHFDGDGVYDPVTEWLEEQGLISEDLNSDGWITVKCPWHAGHTTGTDQAGYSPVGQGDYPDSRHFNCFHDNCAGNDTNTFLTEVADLGGPRVPVRDLFPDLAANNVYDLMNDRIFNIRDAKPAGIPLANMKKTISRVKMVIGEKTVDVHPYDIWLKLASCVRVSGTAYDPTQDTPLVETDEGLRVNTFKKPDHAAVKADVKYYGNFMDYICYLIPEFEEREFFLDWLACKAQHREYRGPAVVMIAPKEGAGRNTLMVMISKLFGESNVIPAALSEFESPTFNEYMASLFCYVDESIASQDQGKRARFYEGIKTNVDPLAQNVVINAKHEKKMLCKTVTSFLFFSNHEDALHVTSGTRRIYALRNTEEVKGPEFFGPVHAWLKRSDWQPHVWQWLLDREVDMAVMSGAPPKTQTFHDMTESSKSGVDHVIEAVLSTVLHDFNCHYVNTTSVRKFIADAFETEVGRMGPDSLNREIKKQTFGISQVKSNQVGRIMTGAEGNKFSVRALTEDAVTNKDSRYDSVIPFQEVLTSMAGQSGFKALVVERLNAKDS